MKRETELATVTINMFSSRPGNGDEDVCGAEDPTGENINVLIVDSKMTITY